MNTRLRTTTNIYITALAAVDLLSASLAISMWSIDLWTMAVRGSTVQDKRVHSYICGVHFTGNYKLDSAEQIRKNMQDKSTV